MLLAAGLEKQILRPEASGLRMTAAKACAKDLP